MIFLLHQAILII